MGVHVRERPKGSGVWWLDVVHNKQRLRRRVGTKAAAEKARIEVEHRLAIGGGDLSTLKESAESVTPAPVPTFKDVAGEWQERYPALHVLRPSTRENYESFIRHHLLPYFGALPITSITTDAIEEFIEAKRLPGGSVVRHGKPLGNGTLQTGLVVLGLILRRAAKRKLIPANPMREVEWRGLSRSVQHVQNVDPFTTAELQAILRAARQVDADFATFLQLWMQSGLREGEVLALQQQDVNVDRGTVLVRRTWSRERLGPTKTGLERQVSILHPVADGIPDWRPGSTADACSVVQGLHKLKVQSLDPAAFVFGATSGAARAVRRKWHRVLAAARVRYRNPEQLRHTWASTLLSRNAPLLYVQSQGGWRTASVLLKVYARWLPQEPVCGQFQAPSGTQLSPRNATAG